MLRLIDRYLIREIAPYFLLGLLLLTAIIFTHESGRFTELLVVASRNGLPMEALWRLLAALVPGILVFTLPIALLVGTLVGLGRLSGDSEMIALGASGINRTRILRPVVGLALLVAALMLYITFHLLPVSVKNLNQIKENQALVFQGINAQIKPRVFEESIPKRVLYIEDIDRATNIWRNIFLVDLSDEQNGFKIFTAASGSLRQGARSEMPELYLHNGAVHQIRDNRAEPAPAEPEPAKAPDAAASAAPEPAPPAERGRKRGRKRNREREAQAARPPDQAAEPDAERRKGRGQDSYGMVNFQDFTLGLEVGEDKREEAAGDLTETAEVKEMTWGELLAFTPPAEEALEWRAEIHRRLALPAACLVFALLGVGFGISNVRTGRSFGLLLGLAITILYYLIALSGEHAAVTGKLPVWLGVWLANIVLALAGVLVIWRQRRSGADVLSVIASLRHMWRPAARSEAQAQMTREQAAESQASGALDLSLSPGRARALRRFLRGQLLDRLVLSDLLHSFLYILAGFSALFIIITLFQLLNSIARNNVEWSVVANYLFYLLPMIVNYMAPLAALVAVMVTFGVLQKTSQVVALKASGLSIYRLAAPVLLAALLLSALVFVNQDYILPFTNRRQNNLRHLIRSGQEPPQTFYQTTNQWIFGLESRIYNYSHFDPTSNSFARLNIIDLGNQPFGITRRIYARRGWWDAEARQWVLENGWERRFAGGETAAHEAFKQRSYALPEHPDYFKKDARGSSSMTLTELTRKIEDLSRAGFDVLDLRIALQSKIAFPATCLIMVLVGLPFSLSVGKRGALYGVAIGIAIGLLYWGIIGLFEQMGRYEMLPPLLAAWAPNLLFGAGGLYLFLTSRT